MNSFEIFSIRTKYDKVADDICWAIVMNYLPELEVEIDNYTSNIDFLYAL